jgi:hypothetical protein
MGVGGREQKEERQTGAATDQRMDPIADVESGRGC